MAVIPVKSLAEAKSRLEPFLTNDQRRRLVKSMLRRVIRATKGAGAEVWVLGADDSSRPIALEERAGWRREAEKTINKSLRLVFEEAWNAGKSPLFLPGDLPFLTSADVKGLIAQTAKNSNSNIILSAANSGGGTNAVLIPQKIPFQFQLGPDSFSRHVEEARRLGLEPVVHNGEGLARDLDTGEDLQVCETLRPGFLADLTRGED